MLVVFNAADLAHRVFAQVRGSQSLTLSTDLLWKFGRVRWGEFEPWLAQEVVPTETVSEIQAWLRQQSLLYLKDIPTGAQATCPTETLMGCLSQVLEEYRGGFRRLITFASKDEHRELHEAIDARLQATPKASRLLWNAISSLAFAHADSSTIMSILDTWIENLLAALERLCTRETFTVTAPDFPEISAMLQNVGTGFALAQLLTNTLRYLIPLTEQDTAALDSSSSTLFQQQIGFSALSQVIQDQPRYTALAMHIRAALTAGQLNVEARHIAIWKNTDIPVLLYTGKMTKAERDGLINAFALLPQAILISTPAVEVGVDFAADLVVTEECDGNAFLQRVGRVGRRSDIQGSVIVFLKDRETYDRLDSYRQQQMSRSVFSDLIAHPTTGIFPRRTFASRSLYVEMIRPRREQCC